MSLGAASTLGVVANDVDLVSPPTDDISQIVFSPTSNHLAVSAWNGEVRVYEIGQNMTSTGVSILKLEGPALGCAWSPDGKRIFGFGADKSIQMQDLLQVGSPNTRIGSHDEPITAGRMISMGDNQILATASLDKTIRYWDIRQPQYRSIGKLTLPERIYAMDTHGQLLVAAQADRQIAVVNLLQPEKLYKNINTNLKWQLRSVACFPDSTGFAAGSIEGRCAIQYIEEAGRDFSSQDHKTFSFKCHRVESKTSKPSEIYAVNAIAFHPIHHTFATAGGDGTFHFWDKDSRHRLRAFPSVGQPITSVAFNQTGDIFAYALSYDWAQGASGKRDALPPKVKLHATPEEKEELKPRSR